MDSFVRKYGRYVPFALTIIIIFCCALFLKDHEFSEILLRLLPGQFVACRICYTGILWIEVFVGGIPACGYFCVRGCNISVLGGHFVECNRTIGVFYCLLILWKRISGGDIMRVIEMKYPKARKLVNYGHDLIICSPPTFQGLW